jgi:hypothetical protein
MPIYNAAMRLETLLLVHPILVLEARYSTKITLNKGFHHQHHKENIKMLSSNAKHTRNTIKIGTSICHFEIERPFCMAIRHTNCVPGV